MNPKLIEAVTLPRFGPTHAAENVENMLRGFKGYLQSDSYPRYKKTGAGKDVVHPVCWTHARRQFFEAMPPHNLLP